MEKTFDFFFFYLGSVNQANWRDCLSYVSGNALTI